MKFKVGQKVTMIPFEEQLKLGLQTYLCELDNKILRITGTGKTNFDGKTIQSLDFGEEDGIFAIRFKLAYDGEEFE